MKSKKFDTFISTKQMNDFKSTDNKEGFIEAFIEEHRNDNVTSEQDVYSLLLDSAIAKKDIELITYILDHAHGVNIFTHINSLGFSPISSILLHLDNPEQGNIEILQLFNTYFSTENIEQNVLISEDYQENIPFLLSHLKFDDITLEEININFEKMVDLVGLSPSGLTYYVQDVH